MGKTGLHDRESLYVIVTSLTIVALSSVVFLVNFLVDPGWKRGGGVLGRNIMTNERHSKVNLFLARESPSDCLILGSSRTALLHGDRIEDQSCFNFSFSGASFRGYLEYARWFSHYSDPTHLVIVGVDGYNLKPVPPDDPATYNFIRDLERPPSLFREYVTIGSLRLSIANLFGITDYHRGYDTRLRGIVFEEAPHWVPPDISPVEEVPHHFLRHLGPFSEDAVEPLKRLRSMFPDASFIGYVPPIHPFFFEQMRARGELRGYLDAVFAASRVFDRFFDFSIPSEPNANSAYTYDGSHYRAAVNEKIAEVLNGADADYGIALHGLHRFGYREAFGRALDEYESRE
jgi:hypothetical protein